VADPTPIEPPAGAPVTTQIVLRGNGEDDLPIRPDRVLGGLAR